MSEKELCAVCGQTMLERDGLCPVCKWVKDIVQEDEPDEEGGQNFMSLNMAKKHWKETGERVY